VNPPLLFSSKIVGGGWEICGHVNPPVTSITRIKDSGDRGGGEHMNPPFVSFSSKIVRVGGWRGEVMVMCTHAYHSY